MAIVKVQGNARGTIVDGDADGAGSFTVTQAGAPTNGNLNILTFTGGGNGATNPYIGSVTQAGVTWTLVIAPASIGNQATSVWKGVVGAGAGAVATVNFAGGSAGVANTCIADICEWSGLSGTVDRTASNNGGLGLTGDSGTTAATTENDELAVAAIGGTRIATESNAQSGPTSGYTMLDGATLAWNAGDYNMSLSYDYKILAAAAAQNVQTTFADTSYWTGCIATFKVSAVAGGDADDAGFSTNPARRRRRLLVGIGRGTILPMWNPQSWKNRFPKLIPKVM